MTFNFRWRYSIFSNRYKFTRSCWLGDDAVMFWSQLYVSAGETRENGRTANVLCNSSINWNTKTGRKFCLQVSLCRFFLHLLYPSILLGLCLNIHQPETDICHTFSTTKCLSHLIFVIMYSFSEGSRRTYILPVYRLGWYWKTFVVNDNIFFAFFSVITCHNHFDILHTTSARILIMY